MPRSLLKVACCFALLFAASTTDAAPILYEPFAAGGAAPNAAAGQYRTGTGWSGGNVATTDAVVNQAFAGQSPAPTVTGFAAANWTAARSVWWNSSFASQLPVNTATPSYDSFIYNRAENTQLGYQDAGLRTLNTTVGQVNLFRDSGSSTSGKQLTRNLNIGTNLPSQMYFSMLTQVTNDAELNVQFTTDNITNGTDFRPFYFGINENGNPYVTGTSVSGGSTISAVTTSVNTSLFLDDGQPHFLLIKLTDGGTSFVDRIDLYVDPNLLDESLNTPAASINVGNFYVAGNADWTISNILFDYMNTAAGMSVIMDELRMGYTWADVAPFTQVPEPASWLLFALVGLACGCFAKLKFRGTAR